LLPLSFSPFSFPIIPYAFSRSACKPAGIDLKRITGSPDSAAVSQLKGDTNGGVALSLPSTNKLLNRGRLRPEADFFLLFSYQVKACRPVIREYKSICTGDSMNEFETYLKKAGDFHGHVCTGIALGTKMSLAALKHLGFEPGIKNKNLIVYAEIDRCMTDAVQTVTGCTLGHRSLKHIDYGKFAATLVDIKTNRAVRAIVKESFNNEESMEDTLKKIAAIPESELVTLQDVTVNITENDLPGFPRQKACCEQCGERIMDGREVVKNGRTLCRGCAGGKYYTEIAKNTD
jgi:formylmethanofuran dehydrogenase subunit E